MLETLTEVTRGTHLVAPRRAPALARDGRRTIRHVLVIRDDQGGTSLAQMLREDGNEVQVTTAGSPAVDHIVDGARYDLVVIDTATTGKVGSLTFVRALREWGVDAPLMLLTAADRVAERVAALDAGADDVMTKPFASDEVRARLRALLRRSAPSRPARLQLADLVLDPATHAVSRAGRRLALTPREFALLEYFLRNVDRVLTRSMILAHVWGIGFGTANNLVEVYVGYLRRKVDAGHERRLLRTVRGLGYLLTTED